MEMTFNPTDGTEKNNGFERKCITISIAGLVILSVIGIGSGILTDSATLIIQTFLYIIDVIIAVLSLRILKTLANPPDENYNFGYYKLEPILVNSQGALMIAGAMIGIMFAIQDIIHEDNVKNYFLIFTATCVVLFINFSIWLYLYFNYRRIKSPFLKAAAMQWLSNMYETVGIIGGFFISYLMQHSANQAIAKLSPYIDPAMAIILSLFILKIPVKLYKESLVDLLDANPGKNISDEITIYTKNVLKGKCNLESKVEIKLRKAGRGMFLILFFNVPASYSFEQVQGIMRTLNDAICASFQNVISVNFHITTG
jgi:cation diffusion facilitator family transporter